MKTIEERIAKNRDEINNLMFVNWPLDLVYMRVRMLTAKNEQLITTLRTQILNEIKDR